MTRAVSFHSDNEDDELPVGLRPADIHAAKTVGPVAGPFEMSVGTSKAPSVRDALMTGLLVIYPTLATVVAIVAGLFLSCINGT